ncbi:hypothetical protein ACQZ5D_23820 [Agrobacterium sp. 22-211-1]
MADKELGALSPIEALLAAALFHTVQEGNSRKVTAQQIADFINGNYPAFIQTLLSAQDADDVYAAIGVAPEAETAANADRLGGHLPAFFAAAQDVATAIDQLTKADVGLENVDNTSDLNKPVSTAQQNALDEKVAGPVGAVADGAFMQFDGTEGRKAKALTHAAALTALKAVGAYAKDNILGTVSQSSGVPTGAILETGVNANGIYSRFANGIQVCFQQLELSYFDVTDMSGNWTYPAAFSEFPIISFAETQFWNNAVRSYAMRTRLANRGSSGTTIVSGNPTSSNVPGDKYYVHIGAHGRWF